MNGRAGLDHVHIGLRDGVDHLDLGPVDEVVGEAVDLLERHVQLGGVPGEGVAGAVQLDQAAQAQVAVGGHLREQPLLPNQQQEAKVRPKGCGSNH